MNEPFFNYLKVVTIAHVTVVALLFVATYFPGLFSSHDDSGAPVEFLIDTTLTQEGPAGPSDEAVLPLPDEPAVPPDPPPGVSVSPGPREAGPKPPKPPTPKPPIKISTVKVVRAGGKLVRSDRKGATSHFNPLSAKEIARLLAAGGTASDHNVIPNEDQMQKLRVKSVLDENWVPPSKADAGSAVVVTRLWFGDGGRITKWKMERTSGVQMLDDSVKRLLDSVHQVPGLRQSFINQYRLRGFTVEFKVAEGQG